MGLTKEEKKALKDAKKLEKLKAEMELQKQLKREELKREMAAQALKRDDLDKSWRAMMLKIKEPVFKQDIEIMWRVFERMYDKKDHLISYTMKLANIADDQFQRTIASFCVTIDNMITKFLEDLDALSKENDRRTNELLKRGEDEAHKIMSDHDAAETHLQLLLYHSHTTADALTWTTRGENLVKQDEDRNKYVDERENLRSFLENNYNSLWEEYKAVLKAYIVNTAENQKRVRKLRRKENIMADIIASQGKRIANSDGMLKRLRAELAAYESGTKQAVFRDRRNRHRNACFKLKSNMYNGVETDMTQLARLVKESDSTVEWLESAYKKVEKILRMAALCRKLETQQEKVLPYGSTMPYTPTEGKSGIRKQASEESLVVNAISSTCGLTRLWQRIARAELTKRALQREKTLLEEENKVILIKIEELKEKRFSPDTKKCPCNEKQDKKIIHKPVAIEAALEARKIGFM